MHTIIVFGLATSKYAMACSSEPLGIAPATPSAEDADTQELDMVILNAPLKSRLTPLKMFTQVRGGGVPSPMAFANMVVAVKDVV
jgi:hypothetical protein